MIPLVMGQRDLQVSVNEGFNIKMMMKTIQNCAVKLTMATGGGGGARRFVRVLVPEVRDRSVLL